MTHYFGSSNADCPSVSPVMNRKQKKPLMERLRRQRMNNALDKMKSNVMASQSALNSKLEKADIMEKTVEVLEKMEESKRSCFLNGFFYCLQELQNLLLNKPIPSSSENINLQQLANHLDQNLKLFLNDTLSKYPTKIPEYSATISTPQSTPKQQQQQTPPSTPTNSNTPMEYQFPSTQKLQNAIASKQLKKSLKSNYKKIHNNFLDKPTVNSTRNVCATFPQQNFPHKLQMFPQQSFSGLFEAEKFQQYRLNATIITPTQVPQQPLQMPTTILSPYYPPSWLLNSLNNGFRNPNALSGGFHINSNSYPGGLFTSTTNENFIPVKSSTGSPIKSDNEKSDNEVSLIDVESLEEENNQKETKNESKKFRRKKISKENIQDSSNDDSGIGDSPIPSNLRLGNPGSENTRLLWRPY